MKQRTFLVICIISLALLAGCASSLPSVKMKSDQALTTPLEAAAVSYTGSYFQSRFMGFKPFVGPILWHVAGSYEGRKSERLQSNDYEKLLGEFDVFEYFDGQLKKRASDFGTVRLKFSNSPELAPQIRTLANCDNKDECRPALKALDGAMPNIVALKMSYGLGMRQGKEQLGFRKYYRPFIRVIGVLKSLPSVEPSWQGDILVFGENRYLGGEADADKVPGDELISSFRTLTTQAIDLLVRSLNGETLPEMPVMVDTSAADLRF
ncbi:MAG: hypothetical protein HZA17_06640 [Nitrospirae bacterium]|nr:hypothetical protein [Nitrospirota bacterium]